MPATSAPVCYCSRFFGLPRDNLIFVCERRRPGYTFDKEQERFVRVPGSPLNSCGSGYSMMQLNWPEEAYVVGEDLTTPVPIATTVFDYLLSKGAQYVWGGEGAQCVCARA